MRGHQPPTHHTDRQLPNSLTVASTGRQGASSGYRARRSATAAPPPPCWRCAPAPVHSPAPGRVARSQKSTRALAIGPSIGLAGTSPGVPISFSSFPFFSLPFLLLHTLSSFFFSRTLPSFFLLPPPLYTLPRYEKSAGQGVDFIARASVTLRVTLQ